MNFLKHVFLILATAVVGCSTPYTPPVETLSALSAVGRITDRQPIPEDRGTWRAGGTVPVRVGGGMVFVPAFSAPLGQRPAHHIYEIVSQADSKRTIRVAFPGDIAVGTCVEVWSEPGRASAFAFNYGYAVLRPVDICK